MVGSQIVPSGAVEVGSVLPPGPGIPLRNSFRWMFRVAELLDGGRARYGEMWTLRLLAGTTLVIISDPKLIEDV